MEGDRPTAPLAPRIAHPDLTRTRKVAVLATLMVLNLFLCMDKSSSSALAPQYKEFFQLDSSRVAWMKSIYVIGIICGAFLWGSVANHVNKRHLLSVTLTFWSISMFIGTISGPHDFCLMLASRCIAGFFASSLHVLAIPIISDLFKPKFRPLVINIYIFSAIMGVSSGFVISSFAQILCQFRDQASWKWVCQFNALAVLPVIALSFITIPLSLCKPRKKTHISQPGQQIRNQLGYLLRCRTYLLMVAAMSALEFSHSSIGYWLSSLFQYNSRQNPRARVALPSSTVIGLAMGIGGTLGCFLTGEAGRQVRNRLGQPEAQPVISGCVTLTSGLVMLGAIEMISVNVETCYVLIALTAFVLLSNSAAGNDVIMAVAPSHIRPLASGLQVVFAHLVGEALAPEITGAISDAIYTGQEDTYLNRLGSLQKANWLACLLGTLGGAGVLYSSLTYSADTERANEEKQRMQRTTTND